MYILKQIFDWSEVWALFIPLFVLAKKRVQPPYVKPVITYLWLALLINLLIDISWKTKAYFPEQIGAIPAWLHDNNYLYNIHSVIRLTCFAFFFSFLLRHSKRKQLLFWSMMLLLFFINFIFWENFFQPQKFSSRLLATEAGILLFFCLQYYLYRIREEELVDKQQPDFWIVSGLSIYVILNFFVFLFYSTLMEKEEYDTVTALWDIHNIAFIIFCIFIAKAFYAAKD